MYDTIIIGSGPAGLSAAVYAQRARLNAVVIEKEYQGTGQIAVSERVDNYPGLYGVNGYDLGEAFRGHAEALGAVFRTGEVTHLTPAKGGYEVALSDGEVLNTRTVVYAAGARPRKLEVAGEAAFTGHGVSYCATCDGAFYKNKTVAVVGGGDTALQDAVQLAKIAETVLLVHRRAEFRANQTLQEAVRHTANIRPVLNAAPVEIVGEKTVQALRLRREGQEETVAVDGVFVAVGTLPNSAPLQGVAVLDERGYVIAGEDGVTSAPGLFAAGDVRTKPFRQVVTAAADGASCIWSVETYLTKSGKKA